MNQERGSGYTIRNLTKLREGVSEGVSLLRRKNFDSIVFQGVSGVLIAAPLAVRLKKNLIVVRKHQDCHSQHAIEGKNPKNYIIVDDFISSGRTVKVILSKMKRFDGAVCKGVFLFRDTPRFRTEAEFRAKYE